MGARKSIFIMILFCQTAFGQSLERQVVASCGMEFQSVNFNMSSTIGEALTQTLSTALTDMTQGFHQPELLVTALSNAVDPLITVFPNPTLSEVTINTQSTEPMSYSLHSVNGSSIGSGFLITSGQRIALGALPAGHYILIIRLQNNSIRSFNIIKN